METVAVRGGLRRSQWEETSESIYLSSGYVYDSPELAESAFAGEISRFQYTRFGNPSVATFEERLALLEGAEAAFATATGMAAVFSSLASFLKAGDRLVAARSLFGSCFVICNEILPRFGIETVFVDGEEIDQWEQALSVPTQAVFFETPANPMQTLVDIAKVSELAHAAGATVVFDNGFTGPLSQRGIPLGADVVVYSATKIIDGQGRAMGGAILGTKEFIDGPAKFMMRHTGPSLSPFNAWVLTKGLETLSLRSKAQASSALVIAEWLEQQPEIEWVRYPLLESHPQYELAKAQMSSGGNCVTFALKADDAKAQAFDFLNRLRIVDISNNFGDVKSLITHPATSTHRAMGPEGRAAIGLNDAVVRLSVGLESTEDLLADLEQALVREP
jgi:O-succinylhomoserine sulfhydrylase